MLSLILGIIYAYIMFMGSTCGTFFFLVPYLPLAFFKPTLFRALSDRMVAVWEVLVVAYLRHVMKSHIVVTGCLLRHERSIYIMNHRTRLDWLYFWCCLVNPWTICYEKIILKQPLKFYPGAGWAMQFACYIFLHRRWDTDQSLLVTTFDYLRSIGHNTKILLFPEGTDLEPRTKARSDDYAAKNGLKPYDYVLHPRTTGFQFIANKLITENNLDAIYDITFAYPKTIVQNELSLMSGKLPEEIHVHVERHGVESLPKGGEAELGAWCQARWECKEMLLKRFYEGPRRFEAAGVDTSNTTVELAALAGWSAFVLWVSCALFTCAPVQLYCLFCTLLLFALQRFTAGIELMSMRFYAARVSLLRRFGAALKL